MELSVLCAKHLGTTYAKMNALPGTSPSIPDVMKLLVEVNYKVNGFSDTIEVAKDADEEPPEIREIYAVLLWSRIFYVSVLQQLGESLASETVSKAMADDLMALKQTLEEGRVKK